MRLLILTARPDLRVNARFVEAAAERRLDLDVVDGLRAVAGFAPELLLGAERRDLLTPAPRAVLARVGNWRPESLLGALEIAERAGVPTPNPARALRIGRDHWRSLVVLRDAGLPVPDSVVGSDPELLAAEAVRQFGLPVVVKQRRSRMGVGVIRCDRLDHLEAVLDSLWRVGDEVLVQRFVGTEGTSIRVVVAGGRVVASARFRARPDDWRSNGARGGRAEPYQVSAVEGALALAAARVVGLGICGVDLLPSPSGTVICEVNPTPGFLKVELVTGIDVAGAFLASMLAPGEPSAS